MPDGSNGWANLHLHTRFSDGELSPIEVVQAHAAAGFGAIALTDHDTLAGLDALGSGLDYGLRILAGVELSIEDDPARGLVEVHLLGYGFDSADRLLRARLLQASSEREAQKEETVHRLQRLGYPVDWDSVRALAAGNVGKPHIVAAIEAARPGVSRQELYDAMGPGGAAHVPRAHELNLEEAVALVRQAGGAAVLAHPGVYDHVADLDLTFAVCARAGVSGLEVTYPQDPDDPYGAGSQALMLRFAEVARGYGWVATGGDDFHGPHVTPRIRLAAWRATPASCVDELLAVRG